MAVILDVVYNHFGPSDLDLWQFDGWSENRRGGIYFYNDDRANTPWGNTRPDYGRGEVRQYILDNVSMWLEVVANFSHEPQDSYVIGFPAAGTWKLRFNSDWQGYSAAFGGHPGADVVAEPGQQGGLPFHAALSIGPYSALIFSQP